MNRIWNREDIKSYFLLTDCIVYVFFTDEYCLVLVIHYASGSSAVQGIGSHTNAIYPSIGDVINPEKHANTVGRRQVSVSDIF